MREEKEKRLVALSSVAAAIFLTVSKLVIGLATGSLGILSEALHSGLDFVAALMTFFAVKIADKPADSDHHYGHGKVENLSALFETGLLLITCLWIGYEAIDRLVSGRTIIEVNFWSFAVVIGSIIIDISRSRALSHTAKKYNSQALEADALHFSTDIYSSLVVLIGLVGAIIGYHSADSVAAFIVALLVIAICIRLGKKSIDALLDRSDSKLQDKVIDIVSNIEEVKSVHDVKLRTSGANTFVELNIHINSGMTIEQGHQISHLVENRIKENINKCEVHVHIEPDET